MFTGIIQGLAEITAISRFNQERRLQVKPLFAMANIEDGESIALDGVCLSVENHVDGKFGAYASAETIDHSNLGNLGPGARVNLERALELGQRLGGHIISGHVDCVATVANIVRQGQSLRMRLNFPAQFSQEVVNKGSVALNGISLTVNECGPGFLEVNIIPDSQERSNILQWRPGSRINMETDIIGKYVRNLLKPWSRQRIAINRDFLAQQGFI